MNDRGSAQGLDARRRLKRPQEFARLRRDGQRLVGGCLIMNWTDGAESRSRLGVVTSRKVGKAVQRNRGRRLMREAFRERQADFNRPVDIVLVARPSIRECSAADVAAHLDRLLRRARLVGEKRMS